jgi:probable rRNA maturation factor
MIHHQEDLCALQNLTRHSWDTGLFSRIKEAILGKDYRLSVALIGDTRARTLSRTYRHKDTKSNVLSFPLDTQNGEIFLNPARIKREAHRFDLSPQGHLYYLFIHGCLHLKGHAHGVTMEKEEKHFLRRFHIV